MPTDCHGLLIDFSFFQQEAKTAEKTIQGLDQEVDQMKQQNNALASALKQVGSQIVEVFPLRFTVFPENNGRDRRKGKG